MTPADPPPSTPGVPPPSPEDDRVELQAILAQYHGLLTTIVEVIVPTLPADVQAEIRPQTEAAFSGVSVAFGELNAELNPGDHDEGLEAVALRGEQKELKKRGFWYNLRRFYRALRQENVAGAAKHGVRAVKWGNIIIGSLSKELEKFRFVEVIKEFGEVAETLLDHVLEHAANAHDRAR